MDAVRRRKHLFAHYSAPNQAFTARRHTSHQRSFASSRSLPLRNTCSRPSQSIVAAYSSRLETVHDDGDQADTESLYEYHGPCDRNDESTAYDACRGRTPVSLTPGPATALSPHRGKILQNITDAKRSGGAARIAEADRKSSTGHQELVDLSLGRDTTTLHSKIGDDSLQHRLVSSASLNTLATSSSCDVFGRPESRNGRAPSRSSTLASGRASSTDRWSRRINENPKTDATIEVQVPPLSPVSDPCLTPCASSISPAWSLRHDLLADGRGESYPRRSKAGHERRSSSALSALDPPVPSFSRRHSSSQLVGAGAQFVRGIATSPTFTSTTSSYENLEVPSSAAAASLYLLNGRRSSLPILQLAPSTSSPFAEPSSPQRGRSNSSINLATHFADAITRVGSSIRRPLSPTGAGVSPKRSWGPSFLSSTSEPSSPTQVEWSQVVSLSIRFRLSSDSTSGLNSFLLGLKDMEAGGSSRAWDPRARLSSPSSSPEVPPTRKRSLKWPKIQTAWGEPALVLVEYVGDQKKGFSPDGLEPAQVGRVVLRPLALADKPSL